MNYRYGPRDCAYDPYDLFDRSERRDAKPAPKKKTRVVGKRIELTTEQIYNQIGRNDSGLLPANCIHAARWNGGNVYVFQFAPQYRNLVDKDFSYRLFFPWMIFAAFLLEGETKLFAYLRNKEIKKHSDPLFMVPLPNMFDNGEACLGRVPDRKRLSPAARASSLVTSYWSRKLNQTELIDKVQPASWIKKIGRSFENLDEGDEDSLLRYWESLSPQKVMQTVWRRPLRNHTLENLISHEMPSDRMRSLSKVVFDIGSPKLG